MTKIESIPSPLPIQYGAIPECNNEMFVIVVNKYVDIIFGDLFATDFVIDKIGCVLDNFFWFCTFFEFLCLILISGILIIFVRVKKISWFFSHLSNMIINMFFRAPRYLDLIFCRIITFLIFISNYSDNSSKSLISFAVILKKHQSIGRNIFKTDLGDLINYRIRWQDDIIALDFNYAAINDWTLRDYCKSEY